MKRFLIVPHLMGLTFLVFGTCALSSAATLVVGKTRATCPNLTYTIIGDALKAAAAGDEIDVCPALYPEQLVISKPLTLRGIAVNNINRVLIQPVLRPVAGLPFQAVIAVANTSGVTLQNLAVDASQNSVSGCDVGLAGIHFYNASGTVDGTAVSGGQLADPTSCPTLTFGNGFGIQVDTDGTTTGRYLVNLTRNSIHDFSRSGILVVGPRVTASIDSNQISGIGPSVGVLQFGIFITDGALAYVTRNIINEGLCGPLGYDDCLNLRSEGVTLRAVADGTVVDGNVITNAQSGIFINGGRNVRVSNNIIRDIDILDGIDIQGTASGSFTNSIIEGNTISNVGPLDNEACGINEFPGTGVAGNRIVNNFVNDAYCGVAYVTGEDIGPGTYLNTLYLTLNVDQLEDFPPPMEPAAHGSATAVKALKKHMRLQ